MKNGMQSNRSLNTLCSVASVFTHLFFGRSSIAYQLLLVILLLTSYGYINTASAVEVAHWSFDETSGTTAVDSVGTFDATVSGTWSPGKFNNALRMNGTPQMTALLNWAAPTNFTIEFWLYPESRTNWNQGLAIDGGWGDFAFHTTSDGTVYVGVTTGSHRFTLPANTLVVNTWHHFVFTYAAGNAAIYKDGVLLGSMPSMWPTGAWGSFNANSINGLLDELIIYDHALSAAEVQARYDLSVADTISGTVFLNEGVSADGTGKILRLLVNGASVGLAATDATGAYSFSHPIAAGDRVLVYLDGAMNDGSTVTVSHGGSITDLDVYTDHLIVRHDNAGSMTNTLLASAQSGYSDVETLFTVLGNDLTVSGTNTELYVPSGNTYLPGGTIASSHFENLGTTTLGGAVVTSGNFASTAGVVDTTASNFSITVGGNFSQLFGSEVRANASTLTVSGNFTADGSIDGVTGDAGVSNNYNGATVVMAGGSSAFTYNRVNSNWVNGVNNLVVGHAGAVDTISGNLAVLGVLTVYDGEVTGPNILYIRGEGSPLNILSSSQISVGSLRFNGANQTLPAVPTSYNSDLHFIRHNMVLNQAAGISLTGGHSFYVNGNNNVANIVSYNTNGYDLTISGNLNIGGTGTDTGLKRLDTTTGSARSSTISVAGNYSVTAGTADFISSDSTLLLNGTTAQAVTSGSDIFNNLEITNSSAAVTFLDAFSTTNLTAVTGNSQLTFTGGLTYNISGTLSLNGQSIGSRILLRSSNASQYVLNVTGGPQAVSYVDVRYSDAGTNNISTFEAVNSGNNDDSSAIPHWIFIAVAPQTYTVTHTDDVDDGVCNVTHCSLREAIDAANNNAPAEDTITLPVGNFNAFTQSVTPEDLNVDGDFDITDAVIINGAGSAATILTGFTNDRLFHVTAASVNLTLSNMTLQNSSAANGACVYANNSTTLNINGVVMNNCDTTTFGGAIYAFLNGSVNVVNSTFTNNDASGGSSWGGAVYALGNVTVTGSDFSNNSASLGGGAVLSVMGATVVTSSTFVTNNSLAGKGGAIHTSSLSLSDSSVQNSTVSGGGAIYVGGNANLLRSTISNNNATSSSAISAGGIYVTGNLLVDRSTISGNTSASDSSTGGVSGGGGSFSGGTTTIINSTYSGNSTTNASGIGGGAYAGNGCFVKNATFYNNTSVNVADGDALHSLSACIVSNSLFVANGTTQCSGVTSAGYNLFDADTCLTTTASDIVNAAPLLDTTLANNSGTTLTHMLLPASPAVGTANGAVCVDADVGDIDQVGVTRTSTCDIGAKEQGVLPNTAPSGGYLVNDTIPATQVSQSAFGNGVITVRWRGVDSHSAPVTLHTFQYSIDGGTVWNIPTGGDAAAALSAGWNSSATTSYSYATAAEHSFTINTKDTSLAGLDNIDQSLVRVRFTLNDGTFDSTPVATENFRVDNLSPVVGVTSTSYNASNDTLTVTGSGFTSIAAAITNIRPYVDWTRFVWDINGDNSTTPDVTFISTDVSSLVIDDDSTLTLLLTTAKASSIESNVDFRTTNGADTLDVTAGFIRDEWGNRATGDGVANAAITDITAPAPIGDLTVNNVTVDSIKLAWTASGNDGSDLTASSYELRYSSTVAITAGNWGDASQTTFPASAPQLAGSTEGVTITGILPQISTYYIAIKVLDEASNTSTISNILTVVPDLIAPAPITTLALGAISPTSIQLNWTATADDGLSAPSGLAVGYRIRYSNVAAIVDQASWDAAVATEIVRPTTQAVGGAESYTLTPMTVDQAHYYFSIQVYDDVGNVSGWSNSLDVAIDLTAPNAMTLSAGVVANNSIELNWIAPGDDGAVGTAVGYELCYSLSPIAGSDCSGATLVSGVSAPLSAGSAESHILTGLTIGTTYHFAIRAVDEMGNFSPLSAAFFQQTSIIDTTPPVAVVLTQWAISSQSITVNWLAPGDDGRVGNATSYELRYDINPITEANWNAGRAGNTISGNVTISSATSVGSMESYTVTPLGLGTSYYIAVRALDEVGNISSISNVLLATTNSTYGGDFVQLRPNFDEGSAGYEATGAALISLLNQNQGVVGDVAMANILSNRVGVMSVGMDDLAITGEITRVWYQVTYRAPGSRLTNTASLRIGNKTVSKTNTCSCSGWHVASISETFANSPATGLPWTLDEINNLSLMFYSPPSSESPNMRDNFIQVEFKADVTPPSNITDLTSFVVDGSSVKLAWTAPGDDRDSGRAASYDIRYSTSNIVTATDWNNATQISGEPTPNNGGDQEQFMVNNLNSGTRYYFVVVARDDNFLIGGPSNTTVVDTMGTLSDRPTGGFTATNVIPATQVTQLADLSGHININWKAIDPSSDNVTLRDFEYSTNAGATWNAPANGDLSNALSYGWGGFGNTNMGFATATTFGVAPVHSFTLNTKHQDLTGLRNIDQSDVRIRFKIQDVNMATSLAYVESESFQVANFASTATISSASYYEVARRLTITGTNFSTYADIGADIKDVVDWNSFTWDINGDNGTSTDMKFVNSDVLSLLVSSDTQLSMIIAPGRAATLAAMTGYGAAGGADTLDIQSAFMPDAAGSARLNAPLSIDSTFPDISASKTISIESDPINSTTNPKRIPGAVLFNEILISNSGSGYTDADSIYFIEYIDSSSLKVLMTMGGDGSGVEFADVPTSGLAKGVVSYSNTPVGEPYVYDYTPVPDGFGYDGNITSIRVNTTGVFAGGGSFYLRLRLQVK